MLVRHDASTSRYLGVVEQQFNGKATAISRSGVIEFTLPGLSVSYEASILQYNAVLYADGVYQGVRGKS